MRIATLLKGGLAAAALMFAGTGLASAQGSCAATEFTSEAGQIYLEAETALLQNKDYTTALRKLNELRARELNCYERGAMLRLSAAIKIESGNSLGAVDDLLGAINIGGIPPQEVAKTYYNIAQIYLQNDRVNEAKTFMQRWINAGGRPDRDANWQLAVIYHKTGDNRGAIPYAETVLRTDGARAERQTIDFLIYLYDQTGQLAKKAALLERLLQQDPSDRRVWDAIAGDYFKAGEERKAFEVQKAMYLGGLFSTEDELKRIVNFYNRFDVPFEAAKVLEREMSAGRISKTLENYELLANLYQVAREYERAIPVIESASSMARNGRMDERAGRSYFELGQYDKAIDALTKALNRGGLKEPGFAWVLIGQSHYELDRREDALDAFQKGTEFPDGRQAARGWISFIRNEDATARALKCFNLRTPLTELETLQKSCKRLEVIGDNLPEACATVDERFEAAQAAVEEAGCNEGA